MCKTWTYTYACSRTLHVRLSTCRGNFTYTTKKLATPRASCHSGPSMMMRLPQACGDCQYDTATQNTASEKEAEKDTSGWFLEPFVETSSFWAAESDETWALRKKHPLVQKTPEKSIRPERRREATRAGASPLRREVKPEDVPMSGGKNWEDEWEGPYATLAEEIEAREAEKAPEIRAYEAELAAEHEAWMEEAQDGESGQDVGEEDYELGEPEDAVESLPEEISCSLSSTVCPSWAPGPQTQKSSPDSPCKPPAASQLAPKVENTRPAPPKEYTPPHLRLRRKGGQTISLVFAGQAIPCQSSPQPVARRLEPPHLRRKPRSTSMRKKAREGGSSEEAKIFAASFPPWSAVTV